VFHTLLPAAVPHSPAISYDRLLLLDMGGAFLLIFAGNATGTVLILAGHPAYQVRWDSLTR
jgi:hypothetical protein